MNEEEKINMINYYRGLFCIQKMDIRYFGDKTILDSLVNNVSIVLDSNYNIIDIRKRDQINKSYFARLTGLTYPFDKYTISDVYNIVNGTIMIDGAGIKLTEERVEKEIIMYIQFLYNRICTYFSYAYSMLAAGFDVPSVDEYVNTIIAIINKGLFEVLRLHKIPSLDNLICKLGIKSDDVNDYYDTLISNIIGLYIDNMGLKPTSDYKELEPVSESERVDISRITKNILEEYSREGLKMCHKN